jgi:hypothetical protein
METSWDTMSNVSHAARIVARIMPCGWRGGRSYRLRTTRRDGVPVFMVRMIIIHDKPSKGKGPAHHGASARVSNSAKS